MLTFLLNAGYSNMTLDDKLSRVTVVPNYRLLSRKRP
jgi:hypothetical protein